MTPPAAAQNSPFAAPEPAPKDHLVRLADGRALAAREHGNRHGLPVFYFHGFPGSRLEAGFFPSPALRLIAVDRPGYGRSSPAPGRTLADWPGDIAQLADHLELDRFGVLGISGGGPYAAACAHGLAGRVVAAALVCGLGPPEAPGMRNGRLSTLLDMGRRPMVAGAIAAVARQLLFLPGAERSITRAHRRNYETCQIDVPKERAARTEDFQQFLFNSWQEGLRHGSKGLTSDARVYSEAWPFALRDITVPVGLWHGTEDRVVPVSIARHYAEHIPGIEARYGEGDGHFSIIGNSLHEIAAHFRKWFGS